MKMNDVKQEWKGFFSYMEGYDAIEQYKKVSFTMEIIIIDNIFEGISIDSESENAFNEPATVKGFIDEAKMSFIMKYPCAYFKDNHGKMILDHSTKHPDIHYLGFFDDTKTQITGNWEMTVYEERYGYDYLEDVLNGDFEMRRTNQNSIW
ncbi:hypothetical protein [uncultured Psychroserpens sp.]|uniref:hypothetical protein n=1 Tax=uncultured Psychroserpens sp. TaxID=255436 RepID=UPI00261E7B98|nr:hypothetical protein [uncultured Psychroserpens sp.]